jgi:ArsR family transcriptional regulator
MTHTASLLAALSDRTRLGAIQLLWDGREHCVCEMMDLLDASQSRMSRHLAQLKAVGLVIDRRDAQWVRYRRNPALPKQIVRIVDAVLAAIPAEQRKAA